MRRINLLWCLFLYFSLASEFLAEATSITTMIFFKRANLKGKKAIEEYHGLRCKDSASSLREMASVELTAGECVRLCENDCTELPTDCKYLYSYNNSMNLNNIESVRSCERADSRYKKRQAYLSYLKREVYHPNSLSSLGDQSTSTETDGAKRKVSEQRVQLFSHANFKGSVEYHRARFSCENLNMVNGAPIMASSAKLLEGDCIRLCDQSCGTNPRHCVYLNDENRATRRFSHLNDKIRSIRKCERETVVAQERSAVDDAYNDDDEDQDEDQDEDEDNDE